jgi:hypothetical protein
MKFVNDLNMMLQNSIFNSRENSLYCNKNYTLANEVSVISKHQFYVGNFGLAAISGKSENRFESMIHFEHKFI